MHLLHRYAEEAAAAAAAAAALQLTTKTILEKHH